jgi:arylsulfatase A-like enzyme
MRNIVLIITDTFRWDNLGRRAKMPVRTPALDAFAAERATAIEGFYTGSFPTIPHRADLATGTLGWPHYGWQPIDLSSRNHVAAILGKAGYATQLICDCPHLFNARFQHAFNAAFQHRGQEGDKPLLHLNDPIPEVMPPDKTRHLPQFRGHTLADTHAWTNRDPRCETDMFPAMTGQTAIRWLEENCQAGPFFLWVDFFDPHEPWNPPEYLVRRYDPAYAGTPMVHPNYGPATDYTPEELRNLWAHYAAESELVDRWIGRVLQKLDDLQLWDGTVVLITSDHGMSLGEHNRTGKSNIHPTDPRYWPLYPELGHVPFLVAGGEAPRGKSRRVFGQPSDILPTLCELAGVRAEPPVPFDGKSLAPAILGGGPSHRDVAVTGCFVRAEGDARPRKACTPFLVTDRWGYAPVGARGTQELYDLTRDPLAETDVAGEHPRVVAALHGRFIAHLREHRAPEPTIALWHSAADEAARGSWAVDYPGEAV